MEARNVERADLLTVNEVVEVLRCGRTTVNQILWSGQLPSLKIGRRRLIRREDLYRFIHDCHYVPGE